jgi:hypothetical protein
MNVNPDETKSKVFSQENVAAPAADPEPNVEKTVKKRTWKKPKDKPKRPLSSYNIFFRKFTIVEFLAFQSLCLI